MPQLLRSGTVHRQVAELASSWHTDMARERRNEDLKRKGLDGKGRGKRKGRALDRRMYVLEWETAYVFLLWRLACIEVT